MQSATLTGCKYRVRESNPVPQFRRLRCYPAHPHGVVFRSSISTWNRTRAWALGEPYAIRYTTETEPTTGLAPALTGLQNRCLTIRPHRQARAQGVEPCPSVLEADCSPRSTLVEEGYLTGVEPVLPASQAGVPTTYTTDTMMVITAVGSTKLSKWRVALRHRRLAPCRSVGWTENRTVRMQYDCGWFDDVE